MFTIEAASLIVVDNGERKMYAERCSVVDRDMSGFKEATSINEHKNNPYFLHNNCSSKYI